MTGDKWSQRCKKLFKRRNSDSKDSETDGSYVSSEESLVSFNYCFILIVSFVVLCVVLCVVLFIVLLTIVLLIVLLIVFFGLKSICY